MAMRQRDKEEEVARAGRARAGAHRCVVRERSQMRHTHVVEHGALAEAIHDAAQVHALHGEQQPLPVSYTHLTLPTILLV